MSTTLKNLTDRVKHMPESHAYGRVVGISGLTILAEGVTGAAMGSRCRVEDVNRAERLAEVVGYSNGQTLLMPFGGVEGIGPGCRVTLTSAKSTVLINNSYMGRVINALGEPIDGKGPLADLGGEERTIKASPPPAGQRQSVGQKMNLGVRSLNTFVPLCEGQRMGIFAGSGVGKSVLMSMIAKNVTADVTVIGLIGERGREVREFIDEQLGEAGMHKTVVIVATSDEPPLMRRQAAYMTLAVAEYFRDCGFKVMMMMDSVTRFALAQREIGLSAGEPPTTRGFTPSVFAELPKLMERAGPGLGQGFISAIFTILVEGGDMEEPVADAVRGILDGHILLTRKLAERNHFPSVDVLKSVSRMVPKCLTPEEHQTVIQARQLLSDYTDMEELIRLGAYNKGSNPAVDTALAKMPALETFLKQHPDESSDLATGFTQLQSIVKA